MLKPFLQTKLYPLTVTGKNIEYEGSLGLSRELMAEAGLEPWQVVNVVNLSNGERFETYLIESANGLCELNGGAARLGEVSDRLIVMAFIWLESTERPSPRIIKVDEFNQAIRKK